MSAPTKIVKTKLFIGNLDPSTQPGKKNEPEGESEMRNEERYLEELSEFFSSYGAVLEASVIKDYGFVVSGELK